MTIQAVLFDLGNTLVAYYAAPDFPPILRRCVRACIEAVGLSPSQLDEEQLFAHATRLNREQEDHAVRPLRDRLRELLEPHAIFDDHTLEAACTAFLAPIFGLAKPDAKAVSVLKALQGRGVKTGIVSNTPWGSPATAWRRELARLGLLDEVDTTVFCVDVGWRKPHPAPFERALQVLSVARSEAIFVGDDLRWDVVGARRAGLRPVLLSSTPVAVGGCERIGSLPEVLRLLEEVGQ